MTDTTEPQPVEVDADTVANRAAQVISSMGAEIRALKHERDRYRGAWRSARERAQAYGEGILRVVKDRESYQEWLRQAEEAASVVVPAADRAALAEAAAQAIRDAACPGGDCPLTEEECAEQRIQPAAWERGVLSEVYGRPEWFTEAVLSVLPAPADRAAVLREAADVLAAHPGAIPYRPQLDEDGGFWWDTRDRDAAAELLRRMAGESAVVDRVPAETPAAETGCAHCGGPHDWDDCEAYTALVAAESPAVVAQPGKDTETRTIRCADAAWTDRPHPPHDWQ
jgi:hypothetical protein